MAITKTPCITQGVFGELLRLIEVGVVHGQCKKNLLLIYAPYI